MSTTRRARTVALIALGVAWGTNFVFMQVAVAFLTAAQITLLR